MNECVAMVLKKSEYPDEKSWRYDREKVASLKKRGYPFVVKCGHIYVYPKTMPIEELKRLRAR